MSLNLLISIFAFIVGASIGSFLTVCIYRIPAGRSIVSPRSSCDSCGRFLTAIDLIPILSALFLHGKCRKCGAKFSMRHAWIEFFTGLMFAWIAYLYGINATSVLMMFASCVCIVAAFIDIDVKRIPNRITYFAIAVVFAYIVVALFSTRLGQDFFYYEATPGRLGWGSLGYYGLPTFLERVFAALGIGLVLGSLSILTDSFGMGDAKLAVFLGLTLGYTAIGVLFLAFILGAVASLGMMLFRKMTAKQGIPMGPFFLASFSIFLIFSLDITEIL